MRYKTTKKILRYLSGMAKGLPADTYVATGYEQVMGADLIKEGSIRKDGHGKDIDAGQVYTIKVPIQCPVNHKRRMKRAYQRSGPVAVFQYLARYQK